MTNQDPEIVFNKEMAAAYDTRNAVFAPLRDSLNFIIRGILADGSTEDDENYRQRVRNAYSHDLAVLPPSEVASIIAAGGFDAPVLFFQNLLMHAWYARRNTIVRSDG